jgi:hypothetical protein
VLSPHEWDVHLQGRCDEVVAHLCAALGWDLPPIPPPADGTAAPADADAAPASASPPIVSGAPRFVPPNRHVFASCAGAAAANGGDGDEVGAQTPLAVHPHATYPKQLRRIYSSLRNEGPSSEAPTDAAQRERRLGVGAPAPRGKSSGKAPVGAPSTSSDAGTSGARGESSTAWGGS